MDDFRVEVRESGGAWREVPVELLAVGSGKRHAEFPPEALRGFDGIGAGFQMARAALCEFFWERPVEVRVTAPGFDGLLGLSSRRDLPEERPAPGCLLFRLDGPEMALVRKGDDYVRGLSLLARPIPAAPANAAPRQILRFGSGFHAAGNNPLIRRDRYGAPVVSITGDDTLVVIEPGARVEAAFDICGAKRVEICGGGRIDLSARLPHAADGFADAPLWGTIRKGALPAIYIHGDAEDVTVRDITMICDFRGVCTRNARGVHLSNLGIFTATTNADGVNMIATEDVVADSLCLRSQDDCFCAYNNCDSIQWLWDEGFAPRPMRRVRLARSLLASNCRAFVFGGHGIAGTRGGPNVLEDFEVSGCRVLGNVRPCDGSGDGMEHQKYWGGIFRILSQSDEWVRDIRFRNIVVEWVPGYFGSAYHICVRTKEQVSYGEKAGGWKIEDVSFSEIEWRNVPPPDSHAPDVLPATGSPSPPPAGRSKPRSRFSPSALPRIECAAVAPRWYEHPS